MKKFIFVGMLLCVLTISGCSFIIGGSENSNLDNSEPPISVEDDSLSIEPSTGSSISDPDSPSSSGELFELEFVLNDNGDGYTVAGIDTHISSEIIIPAEYNGLPVTRIGDNAFYYYTSLTSIEIPDSVTSIGASAFCSCSSLISIEIPDSVTSIGVGAFCGCSSLTSIVIPDSVISLGDFAFDDCLSLTIYCEASSNPSEWGAYWNKRDYSGWWMYDYIWVPVYWGVTKDDIIYQDGIQFLVIDGNAVITGHTKELKKYFGIPRTITVDELTYNVTSIGKFAFSDCNSLSSLTIPNYVTSVGEGAFFSCDSLTSLVIQNGVKSIGKYAFLDCSSLTSIIIPNSVEEIGLENNENDMPVFKNCDSLTIYCEASDKPSGWNIGWNYDNRPVYWGINENNYSVQDEIIYMIIDDSAVVTGHTATIQKLVFIPSEITIKERTYEVTSIGDSAFYGCSSSTFNIPSTVTSIGKSAFENCESLTSIIIPSSVTSIGSSAFEECTSLASIEIPSSVTSIGDSAFHSCSSLKYYEYGNCYYLGNNENHYLVLRKAKDTSINEATISNKTRFIMNGAFRECSSLISIVIPSSVTSIGSSTFEECTSLASIEIPSSVTSIGDNVFYHCSSLTSIVIPSTITSIGNGMFCGCSSLSAIEIPSTVTSIGGSAFYNCESLTTIVIPSSVTSIGRFAFYGCKAITIYSEASSKPSDWNLDWNYFSSGLVYWSGEWHYDDGNPVPNA